MKKIITICAAILMTATVFAQSPNKMSYQAIIRNSSNALVTSSTVGMRISILQTTPSGTAVYVETQTPTTNANGLVSIEIGGGTVVSGNFANINWANGPYFVKTETDPLGGSAYSITGSSQLLSVPYALHAKTVEIDNTQDGDTTYWKVNNNNLYYNQGFVGIGTNLPTTELNLNGNQSEITIQSTGNQFHHGAVVFKAVGGNAIPNKRAMGLFMLDNQGSNEWFVGRPYGSILGGTSDQFVIQRLNTNLHDVTASGVANGANSPTGTTRLFTLTNSGNVGIGIINPTSKMEVAGDAKIYGSTTSKFTTGEAVTLELPQSQPAVIFTDSISDNRADIRMTGTGDIRFSTGNTSAGSNGQGIKMLINDNGNIGIGTVTPARTLHVNDVMRLEPRSSAPASPAKGDIYFDNTLNKLRVYDGTTWQNCW